MLPFADPDRPQNDVVVTGIGMVTPLGNTAVETWHCLCRGDRGGRVLAAADIDHFDQLARMLGRPPVGAPARSTSGPAFWPFPQHSGLQRVWQSEPFVTHLLGALQEATCQAGLSLPHSDPDRLGCVIGASKGGLRTMERLSQQFSRAGGDCDRDAARAWSAAAHPDAPLAAASAVSGARAFQTCPVAACASGLVALLQAADAIHNGRCDICLAGSSDAGLRASVIGAFHRLRVTSRHEQPQFACRPFDVSRDGFVIGEGAAAFVVESRAHAEQRGARPLARVTAGGWLCDPAGITQITTDGSVVSELVTRTIGQLPDSTPIDWVNVHGTGTESNDLAESAGLERVFGRSTAPAVAWKGALGHLLGAAGSVEAGLTIMSLCDQMVPGTTNLIEQDPACRIRLLTETTQLSWMRRALKLSLGFGGHVACAVFDAEARSSQAGQI